MQLLVITALYLKIFYLKNFLHCGGSKEFGSAFIFLCILHFGH
jgi:hypothetical protein